MRWTRTTGAAGPGTKNEPSSYFKMENCSVDRDLEEAPGIHVQRVRQAASQLEL